MNSKYIPVYRVTAGTLVRDYATKYHAEQMANALKAHKPLAGVPVTVSVYLAPNDPLTRLTVS
jgi:hypothetical protein